MITEAERLESLDKALRGIVEEIALRPMSRDQFLAYFLMSTHVLSVNFSVTDEQFVGLIDFAKRLRITTAPANHAAN